LPLERKGGPLSDGKKGIKPSMRESIEKQPRRRKRDRYAKRARERKKKQIRTKKRKTLP